MPAAVAIILNGISRRKKEFYQKILPEISRVISVEVFETRAAGHAIELASTAAKESFGFILAAGGDGTLNQVVNGIMHQNPEHLPVVGSIPLGTGNDFARTMGITRNPKELVQRLNAKSTKPVDLGRITFGLVPGESVRYFINACSLGMGPSVVDRLERSNRSWGPGITYWTAITRTFFTYRPLEIALATDTMNWKGKILVLVVANGKSFGNALYVAPDANPDDGLLNVFVAGEMPLAKFLWYQQLLKGKKKILDKSVYYLSGTHMDLSSSQKCQVETEGEIAGILPARINVLPSAIRFLK
jgi:diacylglycerol kinase (ATP)